jgi:hypothetical protein
VIILKDKQLTTCILNLEVYKLPRMSFFRQFNRKSLLGWTLLFSIVFLSAQGLGLHIHQLDHNSDHYDYIHESDSDDDHAHVSDAHFAHDLSHTAHHNDVSEIEFISEGLLKSFTTVLGGIFFVYLVVVLTLSVFIRTAHRQQQYRPFRQKYYLLFPPLRAPPLL